MEWLPPSRTITHGNPASIEAREIILKRSTRFIAQLEVHILSKIGGLENPVDKELRWKKRERLVLLLLYSTLIFLRVLEAIFQV